MADKLDIWEDRYLYRIAWFLEEEDDMGAVLGQGKERFTEAQLARATHENDEWEHMKATMTIQQMTMATDNQPGVELDGTGYFWESLSEARKALKMVRAALKDKSNKPWPEWAMKAKAAGWKAPKNWKP